MTYHFSPQNLFHTNLSHYYYLPFSIDQLKAPFLHAHQEPNEGKCGFYALNTYLNIPLPFTSFVDTLAEYMVQKRGFATKEDAVLLLHPLNEDGSSLNTLDLLDVDLEMIQGILPIIIRENPEISPKLANAELVPYDLSEKSWTDISHELSFKLQCVDRFILGIASTVENHLVCWRKDQNNCWWKIDSLLSEQKSFKNDVEAFGEIHNAYGSYQQGSLLFLMPSSQ